MIKKINIGLLVVCLQSAVCLADTLSWNQMQSMYHSIENLIDTQFVHAFWASTEQNIKAMILGVPNHHFLYNSFIAANMVRSGFGAMQEYECSYINETLQEKHRIQLCSYQDTDFGGLPRDVRRISNNSYSVSTLGHLFYAARILENLDKAPSLIVEIGGGYGNLARVLKHLYPKAIYIIVDIPEMIALQWLFLTNSTDYQIEVCEKTPNQFVKDIYLMPNKLLSELTIDSCLFISTFALSECTQAMQECVANKNFFNASNIYITGGLHGQCSIDWVNHDLLIKSIERRASKYNFELFQQGKTINNAYEIIARKD